MPAPIKLPPEIEVQRLADDDVRYLLPERPSGRKYGRCLVVVPMFVIAFMIFFAFGFGGGFVGWFGPAGLLGDLLVDLTVLAANVALIGAGLALLYGRATIELRDGLLRCGERVGPLTWTRQCAAADIRRLIVARGGLETKKKRYPKIRVIVLKAVLARGKPLCVTFGYPHGWLLALGQKLAEDCGAAAECDAPVPVEVVDIPVAGRDETYRGVQPAGSQIVYEPLPNGLTLHVPARGIRRGSSGFFVFSLVWCGITLLFTLAWIAEFRRQIGNAAMNEFSELVGLLLLSWTIGVGTMLIAINMGRRRAALAVVGGSLMVIQTSLFGSKRHEWQQAEIKTVCVGPSGIKLHNKPVRELQIVPYDEWSFGMLAGRDVAELQWMATLLRQALLPATDVATFPSPVPTASSTSPPATARRFS